VKVGIYFREAELPEGGGGHTFEASLVGEIKRVALKSSHRFVFLGPPGTLSEDLIRSKCEFVPLPTAGLARAWLRLPRPGEGSFNSLRTMGRRGRLETGLDRQVIGSGVDILWCLGPDVPSLEVPYLVTVWDLQHRLQPFFPEVSEHGIWDRRERYFSRVLRRAAFVIAGTSAGKSEIERFYGIDPTRIVIAPHPTPASPPERETDEDVLARLRLEPGFLFYPGQFWPHKNHISLLHALRALIDRGSDHQLVLAGSDWGGGRHYVERSIEALELSEHVRILGFVDRSDLPALYRNALATTYMSYFGPENLPPLEAFAAGCPVVASNVPGAEEQLGDAAILVNPSLPSEIADAIDKVGVAEVRRSLIAKGTERAATNTAERFVQIVLEAIDSFASVRRNWPGSDLPTHDTSGRDDRDHTDQEVD
jgi:glycosyltransferase involved in cell wall biosynthesis